MKINKQTLLEIIKEEVDMEEKVWSSFRDKYKEVLGVKPKESEMPDSEEELDMADKALNKLKKKDKEEQTKHNYKKLLKKEKEKKKDDKED